MAGNNQFGPPLEVKKTTTIESTTLLLGNAIFTGNWHDTQVDGTCYVTATEFSAQVGAGNGLLIQESDDTTNSNLTRQVSFSVTTAATLNRCYGPIKARYWRVTYQNGATPQTSFELTSTALNIPWPLEESGYAGFRSQTNIMPVVFPGSNIGDGSASVMGASNAGNNGIPLAVVPHLSAPLQGFFQQRTPTVFKYAAVSASGSTVIWTPASGRKFRILMYRVIVRSSAIMAAATDLTIKLLDSATDITLNFVIRIPAAALGSGVNFDSEWVNLSNGILSAIANNALNANLSAALTGGAIDIQLAGTEE